MLTEEQLLEIELACRAKRAIHWDQIFLLLATVRELQAGLARIHADEDARMRDLCKWDCDDYYSWVFHADRGTIAED